MEYAVTIKATIIKTISVTAGTYDDAIIQAAEQFNSNTDITPELYNEDVIRIVEKAHAC